MAAAGIAGSGYEFVDFVLILGGVILALATLIPTGRPRPATPLLAGIGAVAAVFAIVPGVLDLTAAPPAKATTAAFPQRVYLAGTVGDGRIRLFLNGKQVAEGPAPKDIKPSRNPFEIGGVKGSHGWNGSVDSVAVWSAPLRPEALRSQFKLGSSGSTATMRTVMRNSGPLVRWYELGDVRKGAKDSVTGRRGRNIGAVGQSMNHVATGDKDSGSAKFLGNGRISTPPLLSVQPSSFTIGAWVQSGVSISNRTIAGVEGAWILKTDLAGHWTFGVKQGQSGYTVTSADAAKRFVPGQATNSQAANSSTGISVPGLIAAMLVLFAALLLIPSVRRRVVQLLGGARR